MLSAVQSCLLTQRDGHRMIRNQRGSAAIQMVWGITAIVVIAAAFMIDRNTMPGEPVKFTTPYQAVLLTNGTAYFCKLESYGTPHPVLSEVYCIVTHKNHYTNQSSNVLAKT